MRWKQIVGWLALNLLFAALPDARAEALRKQNPIFGRCLFPALISRPCSENPGAQSAQDAAVPPVNLIRRVAILRLPPSTETRVLDAIDRERTMRTRHRSRPKLFGPNSGEIKPGASVSQKTQKGSIKTPKAKDAQEPQDDPSLTVRQLQTIGIILFEDSLLDVFHTSLNMQIVPENEVENALKELGLTLETVNTAASAEQLSERLHCDAIIVPRLLRLRLREGETRDLAFWASLRVYRLNRLEAEGARNSPESPAGTKTTKASIVLTEYPVSGAASSERAPFQSRYLKGWTQLVQEAGKQTAGIASKTFLTGIIAPLARQSDIVVLTPVESPSQADALVFKSAGRRLIPNALTHLPSDVSARFHPPLLPLFDEAVLKSDAVKSAMSGLRLAPDSLWSKSEMPDTVKARLLGIQMRAGYILMARIGDLEIAQEMGRPRGAAPSSLDQNADARESASGLRTPSGQQVSATAEAIGAFVRVSDGALLWYERTTATSTTAVPAGTPEGDSPAARRAAMDAIKFALLQLERRFRQYRSRYEQ